MEGFSNCQVHQVLSHQEVVEIFGFLAQKARQLYIAVTIAMKTFKDSLPFPWKAETASLADIARHLYDRGNESHECILHRKQACSWLQHYQGVCF